MKIEKSALTQSFMEVLQEHDIALSDIPNIDLYMDQIMSLFNQELQDRKRNENDKLITKTMINNYSKEGLIKPIKGKKYSKDHLILLLFIFSLKQTLSLQDIKKLFEMAKTEMMNGYNYNHEYLSQIYSDYLLSKENQKKLLPNLQEQVLTKQEEQDLLLTVLSYCAVSSYFQKAAQNLIDQYTKETS